MGAQDAGRHDEEAAIPIDAYRRFWESSLDQLEEHLHQMEGAKTKSQTNGLGKKRSKASSKE